jgi:hypothetical protein
MRFMRSLPLNFLRAYFLALQTNIFLKRESVNTKPKMCKRAPRRESEASCIVVFPQKEK